LNHSIQEAAKIDGFWNRQKLPKIFVDVGTSKDYFSGKPKMGNIGESVAPPAFTHARVFFQGIEVEVISAHPGSPSLVGKRAWSGTPNTFDNR
jgi:hypothetical protein